MPLPRIARNRPRLARQFRHVEESERKRGLSVGRAAAAANAVVKRTARKHRNAKRGRSNARRGRR